MFRDWHIDVSPDVGAVIKAIGRALNGRALTPEALLECSGQFSDCLAGHVVRVEHRPRPPKGTKPRLKAVYVLSVKGARLDGQWVFTPGQLNELIREARTSQIA